MELQINTDGGSRGNPGNAAYGVVFQIDGEVVFSTGKFLGVATNNEAEYAGLIAGFENLIEKLPELQVQHPTLSRVKFVMDSNLVVNQVLGRWKIKEPRLRSLCEQVLALRKQCTTLKITLEYARRELNTQADQVVNAYLDLHEGTGISS